MTAPRKDTYGAKRGSRSVDAPEPKTLIEMIRLILNELTSRAPAVLAAAAEQLGDTRLCFQGSDGPPLFLRTSGVTIVTSERMRRPHVRIHLSDTSTEELLNLDRDAMKVPALDFLDVQGSAERIFQVWRAFQVISVRAAGLRYIQQLWIRFRQQNNEQTDARVERPDETYAAAPVESIPISTVAQKRQKLWNGHKGTPWWRLSRPLDADLLARMASYRDRVHKEVLALIPDKEPKETLYDLLRDYPCRGGKMLRPILLLTTCRALGGTTGQALRLAAAMELFQNGFLIHDDIEDGSDIRRGQPCLHQRYGIGLAINAGDAMNLLALETVLSNVERLGLVHTLAIMDEVITMCKETVEGQAMELGWIRNKRFPKQDETYLRMVTKKTAWYTTIAPSRLGALAAGRNGKAELAALYDVFSLVGIAFQIQDDVLNLVADEEKLGKELLGDLLEGKRTLMTTHLLRTAKSKLREKVEKWLMKERNEKRPEEARWLLEVLNKDCGSVDYARRQAASIAKQAADLFESQLRFIPENEDKATLRQVVHYVAVRYV